MKYAKLINPLIYALLCFIWGSTFLLMKFGMYDSNKQMVLSAYQVAAIRVISAGVILLPFFLKKWKLLPKHLWPYIILSGFLGVFIPAFLFCIAETHIESSLAGTLNAITPFFVIIFGVLIYKNKVPMRQVLGIAIGFVGIVLLFATTGHINFDSIEYSGYIFIATMCYGLNNNLVKHKLHGVSSLTIATLSFVSLIIPAVIILIFSGYFSLPLSQVTYLRSTFASCILGIVGSALAYIMLFELIKRTTPVFASSILYVTPLVALGWGWFYGELITILQIPCLLIILAGVYLTNPIFKKAQVS